jgi:hypothetical protein
MNDAQSVLYECFGPKAALEHPEPAIIRFLGYNPLPAGSTFPERLQLPPLGHRWASIPSRSEIARQPSQ